MIIRNENIKTLIAEIPEGHEQLRTTFVFQDGAELVFQEASIANLVRAYITIKTHPTRKKVVLRVRKVEDRKEGYAEWQLMEDAENPVEDSHGIPKGETSLINALLKSREEDANLG